MTLYMQQVLGYSPIHTGFAFVPLSLGMVAGSIAAQQLVARIGVRRQAALGAIVSAAGFLLYTRTGFQDVNYWTALMVPMLISSFGLGIALVPLSVTATANVPSEDAGLASGLMNTSMQIGTALGLAVLTTVAAAHTSGILHHLTGTASAAQHAHALVQGFHLAYLLGAGFLVLVAIVALTVVRSRDLPHITHADVAVAAELDAVLT
jgi:MFS family permease